MPFWTTIAAQVKAVPIGVWQSPQASSAAVCGFFAALMFGSEGGIDGSNFPYSYVSLPLNNADEVAQEIREQIFVRLERNVCVIIADTDKTYKFRNFFFTPRPKPMKGIHSFGGHHHLHHRQNAETQKKFNPIGSGRLQSSSKRSINHHQHRRQSQRARFRRNGLGHGGKVSSRS